MKKAVKIALSNLIYYSGVPALIRKISSANCQIKILAYHRVSNDDFDPLWMNNKIDHFEKQMQYIKKYYTPVSLEEAVELLIRKKKIPQNLIVVTFDDGYKDNYVNAYPILFRNKIPATIFLTVNGIEKNELLWFDVICEAIKLTAETKIDLQKFGFGTYSLDTLYDRVKVANIITTLAKKLKKEEIEAFVNYILERLSVKSEVMNISNTMLNWEEINKMSKGGISYGSHGMTHSILSNLTAAELEYEIIQSKRIIELKTGLKIKLFAYPNGKNNNFNTHIEERLKICGYAGACTLENGYNDKLSNLFALKRINICGKSLTNFYGSFSKVLFASRIDRSTNNYFKIF